MAWLHEPVEPGKPRWTYALTPLAAALAPLAAFSALLPSYLNQQQSDKKFMAEADRSRTDSTWQRIRLDSEGQSAQYNEVQGRFGSPDARTRAVAALQLADLALQRKASADSDAPDDAGYPYFSPTGTQLALALQMEENPDVRAADRDALQKLLAFARANGKTDWQIALANRIADANRRTARSLTEDLGRYGAINDVTDAATLQALATVAPFAAQPDDTILGLRDLMATRDFRADRRIGARLRSALPADLRRTGDAALLSAIQAKALHLIDTRDALAEALRSPKPAPAPAGAGNGMPKLPKLALLPPGGAETPTETLRLQSCFLAGANLWGASLGGAEVTGANFGGANLKYADLRGANLPAAVRLPSSVTKAAQGPDKEQIPALKQKYPNFDWTSVAARGANAAAGPP